MHRRPALRRLLVCLTLTGALLAQAAPTWASGGSYDQTLPLLYPTVPGKTSFIDSYAAGRSGGRVHKATDIMGSKLLPLYASVDGTVCHITGVDEPMPSWGYSLTICAKDGRRHRYIHLNNDTPGTDDGRGGPEWAYAPGIRRGVTVRAGQWVGYMGDSGNAEETQAHLHFEILDDSVTDPYGDHRINPYRSLRSALDAGRVVSSAPDQAPRIRSTRVSGSDRVGTAIATSATWRTAPAAVVAVSDRAAEAIVAGPLATALGGPVLLTVPWAVEQRVVDRVRELGASRVVLVGAAAAIPGVAETFAAAGVREVERVAGGDVYATAAAVAQRVWDAYGTGARSAILALGDHADPGRAWPDALTASWYGSVIAAPVLLTESGRLPASTAAALDGTSSLTVVGGTAAISDGVAAEARRHTRRVQRVSGPTRYETALAVADVLRDRTDRSTVWAATGREWADAVTAGPAVARAGNLFVLIDGLEGGGDPSVGRWLWRNGAEIQAARVLGGSAAVTSGAEQRLLRRAG